jgi:selenide,water dikinase
VYKISDDLALVQTLDFFTPTVDDPFIFGQIAAVNAINDIYAMGGRPLTAMNIVCFPIQTMDKDVLKNVLAGGLDKMREAGVLLVGGHSVEDAELKYGLSVTGTIHPQRVLFNRGARPGDKLILTKPLGTGIISTALKAAEADDALVARAVGVMTGLNNKAAEIMLAAGDIHSCTDITGFGFLGHALETVAASDVGLRIDSAAVPIIEGVRELAETGYVPGGLYRNRNYFIDRIEKAASCPHWVLDICFDPQTAGGLFFSLPAAKAHATLEAMHKAGIDAAAVVGEATSGHPGKVLIT